MLRIAGSAWPDYYCTTADCTTVQYLRSMYLNSLLKPYIYELLDLATQKDVPIIAFAFGAYKWGRSLGAIMFSAKLQPW
jgi:hypothetical protein